jgi:hypothetical protein
MLVAQEPPVEGLLSEFDRFQAEILAAYQATGGAAALMKFVRDLGVTYDDIEPGFELPPRSPRDLAGRGEALITYTFRRVHAYRLDIPGVAAAQTPIVLAGGRRGA